MIDTGMLSTPEHLQALLDTKPGRVKNIIAIQTHFHHDHCAQLPAVLDIIKQRKIPAAFIIHQRLAHQFSGFFTTNLNVFEDNPSLRLCMINGKKIVLPSGISIEALYLLPDFLTHFIPSFVYLLQQGAKGIFFTGDLNPPPMEKLQGKEKVPATIQAIIEYLHELAKTACEKGIQYLDVYADTGHFADEPRYIETFERVIQELNQQAGLTIRLFQEHTKSKEGFELVTCPTCVSTEK
jgi:hypothetical protein